MWYFAISMAWILSLALFNVVQDVDQRQVSQHDMNLVELSASTIRQWGPKYANYFVGLGNGIVFWGPDYAKSKNPIWIRKVNRP